MKKIKTQHVLNQLKSDLIGKDSYRGVTLSYSWMSNQLGHFSLAFIPAFGLYLLFKKSFNFSDPALLASLTMTGFWFVFECYNLMVPLLNKKKNENYIFKPEWKNLVFDTFTDVCFFALGAFVFNVMVSGFTKMNVPVLIVLLVYLMFASKYWYLTKMYQGYAKYPFQFRLSQWNCTINEADKSTVIDFKNNYQNNNHLLVFGTKKSGRTSLGVGLANEFSIQHKSCTYTSSIKLYGQFFDNSNVLNPDLIWSWKDADFLVIDDINPGEPIENDLVSPSLFLSFVDNYPNVNFANREFLKNKNVIWILGNENSQEKIIENSWVKMLNEIGIPSEKIKIINLKGTV